MRTLGKIFLSLVLLSILLSLIFTLVAGCEPTLEELKKKHGPKLEEKLSKLERIRELLLGTPPVRSDDSQIKVAAETLYFNLTTGFWPAHNTPTSGAAIFMTGEAFADLTEHGQTAYPRAGQDLLNVCASLLRNGRCPATVALSYDCPCQTPGVERLFQICETVRYVFVEKTVEYAKPSAPTFERAPTAPAAPVSPLSVNTDAAAPASRPAAPDAGPPGGALAAFYNAPGRWSQLGGYVALEIHVFDLEGDAPRKLGAFRVRVETSESAAATVPVTTGPFGRAENLAKAVENRFPQDIKKKIETEVAGHVSARTVFSELP
jgi:hypothetical protein